ncbi:hypothetical protein [Xylanimonas protaetiae]|uniref:Uncharacterized protein n=1 Tax=Xylanimonas protaetiae TaxID=2509457 RepID=A0A4P6F3M1_9MICO|nr:hypothetical protein [Xylanimonas protaetiae]QAY70480.1 hypothetical protein ET471_10935 [Xylanimonas protaetiae]
MTTPGVATTTQTASRGAVVLPGTRGAAALALTSAAAPSSWARHLLDDEPALVWDVTPAEVAASVAERVRRNVGKAATLRGRASRPGGPARARCADSRRSRGGRRSPARTGHSLRTALLLASTTRAYVRRAELDYLAKYGPDWQSEQDSDALSALSHLAYLRAHVADLDLAAALAALAALDVVHELAQLDADADERDEDTSEDLAAEKPPPEALRSLRTVAPTRAPSLARVRATTAPE